jgi:hypothetical protein
MKALIKYLDKAKPREIMHSVIEERGGINNICGSAEYPRDRNQIYNARKGDMTFRNEKASAINAQDPFVAASANIQGATAIKEERLVC